MSELDQENLDMLAKELPELTDDNLNNIKNKFKEKTMNKKNRFKKTIVGSLSVAACICGVFIGAVNINTAFATSLLDVPVVGSIVKLVTVNKIVTENEYSKINIEIPSIQGLEGEKAQEEINSTLKKRGIAVYDRAIKNAENIKEASDKAGFLTAMPESVSQRYTLIKQEENLLSFKVVTTEIGASGYETADFYNVDLENSKLLNISDLFNENYDYVSVINHRIISKMKEAIEKEEAGYFIDEFKTIDDNTNFYINEEGKLVIVFNEYEIAAGYMGMPEFTIETSVFENNVSDLGYLK
jgi:hypothetical protein